MEDETVTYHQDREGVASTVSIALPHLWQG